MANRHERRRAESKLRKTSAKNERMAQLEETIRLARRAASVGASIGEMPDGRESPHHGEIK